MTCYQSRTSFKAIDTDLRVYWTACFDPAIVQFRMPAIGRAVRAHGAFTLFPVRDAAQTIPTFCSGLGRVSRVVGRLADYGGLLSPLVACGDRYPDRLWSLQL